MSHLFASSLVFANPHWLWIAALLGTAAFFVLLLSYANSNLPLPWKVPAFALKLLAIILLALALLEPVWVDEFPRDGANDLIVVADNSRGLAVADQGASLRQALEPAPSGESPEWLTDLAEVFRMQLYQFDRRLRRVHDYSDLDFSGNASAALTSLKSLRIRYEKRPLAAMVIFTDGNATDTESVQSVLDALQKTQSGGNEKTKDKPIPVYPVLVGSNGLAGKRDLALRKVSVSQSAFEDAPLNVSIQAEARGKFPHGVEVFALDEKEKEVATEPVLFAGEGTFRTAAARLKIGGVKPGVSFYRIGIRSLDLENKEEGKSEVENELTMENNSRLVAADRGRGPYRVLYVAGRPNWEYKFLRRALAGDAEVELVALIRIARREPKFEWRGRIGESGNPLFRGFDKDLPEETQSYDEPVLIRLNTKDEDELREGFPREAATLFSNYRAIILDDVESEFLSAERQNLIESFVSKRGGTVIMLGGQESYRTGKWENTPVARLLPVYAGRLARARGDGPAQYATFNLTREGWLEPWMRLRGNQDEESGRLAYMPEFFSINRVPAIKPGASLLATVTDGERRQHPAIAVQRFGEGKSAAVMIGDFWRWGLKDELLQKDLAKMWRQLIRWAVAETSGQVTHEVQIVSEGTLPAAKIGARVRTDEFLPRDDATVRFELFEPGEGKTEPVKLAGDPSLEEAGLFSASHFIEEEGAYRLKTTARDGEGKVIDELETGWAFNPAADEFRSLEPNRGMLERIAKATGGEVLTMSQLDKLPALLRDLNMPVMDTRQRPFWHTPWIFLLALLCLVGEWGVRRWKGVL